MLYRVYCRRNQRNGSLFPMPDAAFGFGLSAARLSLAVSTIYGNLAVSLMALGKIDEAGTVLSEAAGRNLQSDYLLQVNYWREFLRGNSDEMKRGTKRGSRSLSCTSSGGGSGDRRLRTSPRFDFQGAASNA